MSSRLLFKKSLLQFLWKEGYTHMQLRGIAPKTEKEKSTSNEDDYILVPVKEGFAKFEEVDWRVEPIDSTDISDMLGVEFGIHFWVELPEEVADAYKKLSAP